MCIEQAQTRFREKSREFLFDGGKIIEYTGDSVGSFDIFRDDGYLYGSPEEFTGVRITHKREIRNID